MVERIKLELGKSADLKISADLLAEDDRLKAINTNWRRHQLEKAVDEAAFDVLARSGAPTKEQIDRFNEAVKELREQFPEA